jgi:hypothetical protein
MWGGIDPRGDADIAVSYLGQLGYRTFDDNDDTTPALALGSGWAQSDAVWVAMGHGNAGLTVMEDGATGGPPDSHIGAIYATQSVSHTPDVNPALNSYMYPTMAYQQLNRVKLMVFFSCNSGLDGAPGLAYNGNLVTVATSYLGVDSAIGVTHDIYYLLGADNTWTEGFFHGLRVGPNVQDAANQALANVQFWDGHFYASFGFEGPYIVAGTTKISPVGWGTP